MERGGMRVAFRLPPVKAFWILAATALFFTLLSVTGHALQYFLGEDSFQEFVRLFNISGEGNIPTWFQSSLLLLCSILLAAIAADRKAARAGYSRHWQILAVVFLYLSIDELAQIHELMIDPVHNALETSGFFYSAWIIPGALLTLVFAGAYLGFLFALPKRPRILFAAAGAFYVGGALGLESIGSYLLDQHPEQTIARGAEAMAEEMCEMIGLILFLYALMSFPFVRRPAEGEVHAE